jgi:hypothetical protein
MEMKPLARLNGLGDVVEAAAKATGLAKFAKAVEKATGRPCGCAGRRDKLNQLVPFRRPSDDVHPDSSGTEQH